MKELLGSIWDSVSIYYAYFNEYLAANVTLLLVLVGLLNFFWKRKFDRIQVVPFFVRTHPGLVDGKNSGNNDLLEAIIKLRNEGDVAINIQIVPSSNLRFSIDSISPSISKNGMLPLRFTITEKEKKIYTFTLVFKDKLLRHWKQDFTFQRTNEEKVRFKFTDSYPKRYYFKWLRSHLNF